MIKSLFTNSDYNRIVGCHLFIDDDHNNNTVIIITIIIIIIFNQETVSLG